MEGYFIGINIQKQLLFGVGFAYGNSFSICFGPFSIEVHPHNFKAEKKFSFYNEFSK